MNRIRIGDTFLNLDAIEFFTVGVNLIVFTTIGISEVQFERGRNLTTEEFDTLSAWLLNVTNCPATTVIA